MKIAVMGYGTIGSGVVEVLEVNKDLITERAGEPVEVKYILDLRDFPGDPYEKCIVHDVNTIVNEQNTAGASARMGWVAISLFWKTASCSAPKNISRLPTSPSAKNSQMAVRKILRF